MKFEAQELINKLLALAIFDTILLFSSNLQPQLRFIWLGPVPAFDGLQPWKSQSVSNLVRLGKLTFFDPINNAMTNIVNHRYFGQTMVFPQITNRSFQQPLSHLALSIQKSGLFGNWDVYATCKHLQTDFL